MHMNDLTLDELKRNHAQSASCAERSAEAGLNGTAAYYSRMAEALKARIDEMNEALEQPEQEPVAIVGSNFQLLWCREHWAIGVGVGDKLYTSTPARKPLTDEHDRALCEAYCNQASDEYFKARPQIDSDANRRIFYAGYRKAWIEREAAHGIKETP